MNLANRIISITLGIACLGLALAVQRKPIDPIRIVSSPSASVLDSDLLPDNVQRATQTRCFNIRALIAWRESTPVGNGQYGVLPVPQTQSKAGPRSTPVENGQYDFPPSAAEQVTGMISTMINYAFGYESRIDPGRTELFGDVLVVTQTPQKMANVPLLLEALSRAHSSKTISPVMAGENLAVFHVLSLIRGLESRHPDKPGDLQLQTYIVTHAPQPRDDPVSTEILLGDELIVREPECIQKVQNALEALSEKLASRAR